MAGNNCISAPRHMQAKVHGPSISISQDSALVIEGANIEVKSLELDGALVLQTSRKARLVVDGLKLHNRGWKWQALKAEKPMSEEQYIRYSALSRSSFCLQLARMFLVKLALLPSQKCAQCHYKMHHICTCESPAEESPCSVGSLWGFYKGQGSLMGSRHF